MATAVATRDGGSVTKITVAVTLDQDQVDELERIALTERSNRSQVLRRLIDRALDEIRREALK